MTKGNGTREVEERWREFWETSGIYRYDPSRGRNESFVVDTPPPTVSGALHIGHAFSYAHTDLMVRYRRMRGDNIFYPMGWDDNGVPTERRVQNVFNVRCQPSLPYDPDLKLEWGREGDPLLISRRNFIEACDIVVREDEQKFKEVFQRLALSVDWNYTYATIDERSRYVSQYAFLRLLEKGEAELREAPTMWDVDFQTSISQAELEDRERDGLFYRIRFRTNEGGEFIIATTRPELLPACIAITAHPDDERYRDLIGKTAITPLFGAPVPIVPDEHADPEKGTGILMVCTFGDAADVEKWRELAVPAREVIGKDGRMKAAPWGEDHWESRDPEAARRYHEKLAGSTVAQARKEIAALLADNDAIVGEPEPTKQVIKYFEKGDRPLEFLVTRQWFVKVLDKTEALLSQGRKINWHPPSMLRRYEDWVEGLNLDWNVSRQRYFGVPIPVWYRVRADGTIDHSDLLLPQKQDLPVDPAADVPSGFTPEQRGAPGGFVGDADVFDTWATSSLTPEIPSGWPDDMKRFEALYPNDLRPQAHDIIRTWAFYTIARAYLEDGSIPWTNIAISGFIIDPDRKKMSKSKGNVVLPTDVLDEFGTDAVRYWAASARLGVDAIFDRNVLKEGRRLATKIRNAVRLVRGYEGEGSAPSHPLDVAFAGRTRSVVERVTARWDAWDHSGALAITETWFWSDLCDNYLELTKDRAYAGDASAIGTLRSATEIALRLFAPIVPYVTEDVWNEGRPEPSSIHVSAWPTPGDLLGGQDDGSFDVAVEVMGHIRKAKSEAKVSMRTPVELIEVRGAPERIALLQNVLDDVLATANVREHKIVAGQADEELSIRAVLGEPETRA